MSFKQFCYFSGWWRVMLVYLAGILAGSLWTSVLIPGVFLSGASSGVYALITAHLATVIMNYRWVKLRIKYFSSQINKHFHHLTSDINDIQEFSLIITIHFLFQRDDLAMVPNLFRYSNWNQ